ncbi:MAG: XcyI family restriction endonuclease [Pirellulales bacterium]
MPDESDAIFREAPMKAYMARAQLFHDGIRAAKIDLLIAEIDSIDAGTLKWNKRKLGISSSAFDRVVQASASPHQVFAHPDVIVDRPHLIAYYRNIVAISKKGIQQVLFSTEKYESRRTKQMERQAAVSLCETLNTIISGVIDKSGQYSFQLNRDAILAEIGTELQGSWNNFVGTGAARQAKTLIEDYVCTEALGAVEPRGMQLNNGWTIKFGSEPDVSFLDDRGVVQIAIEIKGSLDRAGAQTRYGEAKKSFGKAVAENPRCHTIYLASCFTDAVIRQVKADGQVRDWFNLTSILYDDGDRVRFLSRVFHIVLTPR